MEISKCIFQCQEASRLCLLVTNQISESMWPSSARMFKSWDRAVFSVDMVPLLTPLPENTVTRRIWLPSEF